jgi:hypothetical protein
MSHAPRLLAKGLLQGRLGLITLALELGVPPLSLLVMMLLGGTAVTGAAALFGASLVPLIIFLLSLAGIAAGVLAGWHACGRELMRARDLLAIPLYVVWKLPLYLGFFFRGRQKAWERTERLPASGGKDGGRSQRAGKAG